MLDASDKELANSVKLNAWLGSLKTQPSLMEETVLSIFREFA